MDSAYFSRGSGAGKNFFQRKCFFLFDALYRPVAATPFVLEDFVLWHGHFGGICPNC